MSLQMHSQACSTCKSHDRACSKRVPFWINRTSFLLWLLSAEVMCGTPFSCRETSVDPQSICQNEDLDELNADHFRSSGLVQLAQQAADVR